jgi:hypothetical protein
MGNDLIFQPYGKDDFYFNFLATNTGNWFFGPCDTKTFDEIRKKSIIHTYIKLKCKNPRYAKHTFPKDFSVKPETKLITTNNKTKLTDINELYVFIVYNSKDNFIFMEYTPDHDEYMYIKDTFNVLSSFVVIGDSLSIVKEHIGTGIGAPKDVIQNAIEEMKDEVD